ncbi:hypothetical protein L202_06585 [Cryptococcus amylolentus CBS 6039]|uniref:Dolichyl-phosphate-mannose--protein mannosyltransferase n=2 Tax=Cryptococcus amylolentus TaxID=104669 RepID=A0A1E3HH31_9TREE|nr:hypothetical protein L202_06585 [Cryptococcus amylolentus CBS 6039]ODN75435.1 hypothetical protein L202_06585 [Cryptococcus amylolentus CBS 6039]ODO03167.1 hypothetical protein I350_06012 [Cryptococcus amylolentus CBS 6273]
MSVLPRKRRTERHDPPALPVRHLSDDDKHHVPKRSLSTVELRREYFTSAVAVTVLTALAFAVRFWNIAHPDQVVFDEVHFGAFAGHYIKRNYYFDVHPPLAKMLNALAAWWVGFDGDFGFDSIGDDYTGPGVPYVGMRKFCAFMGSLTIPVVYSIMRESGYPVGIAAFSAALILFDNGHIVQTRLILLDAALILFMALALLCYIKFHQYRYREFTKEWWFWLLSTGFWLACTLGCKMVGLFTFLTVGAAVLWDLWEILDIKRGHPMSYWYRHFLYRAIGLIIVPFFVYLSFFWVHFKILKFSGPGDSFMSPAFQETLSGNEMLLNAQEIRYYDTITIRHKDTKQFLHSHDEHYPLRYDDGRISSQGQQVTCYPHNDTNNHWQVIPTKEIPASGRGRIVRQNDVIQLKHVVTDTLLLTHDVASPLMPTNQEFTTVALDKEERMSDTHFKVSITDSHDGEPWKTLASHFKLIHVPTKVMLWTHPKALPEWGFGQQEVNGNKNEKDKTTHWVVDEIIADGSGIDFKNRTVQVETKAPQNRAFIKKWFELQLLMLQHNAGLTSTHPYQSNPIEWPFSLSGISFWTKSDTSQQIYMVGNLMGWWLCAVALSVFIGIMGADALARRRGMDPIEDSVRNRLLRNTGFFLGAWAFHYFPFYLMNRQLFLHHYLPAHLTSTLIAGSILNFILIESVNYPVSFAGQGMRLRPAVRAKLNKPAWIVLWVLVAVVIGVWLFLSPLTYGLTMTGDEVNRRKLLSTWSLHFEAKKTYAE